MKRSKKTALVIIYSLIILSCAVSVFYGVTAGAGEGQVGNDMVSVGFFKAFTPDSNILCAIFSAATLIWIVFSRKDVIPYWLKVMNLVGTTAVTLTLIVVVCFLSPKLGWLPMFSGGLFHLHFFNPALAIAAHVILSHGTRFTLGSRFMALLPVLVYGAVYFYCVMVAKIWNDFYGFSFGMNLKTSVISAAVISVATFGIASVLSLICKKRK